uniref:Uncharacterized protein n=1 Tax=Kalanchoe fedtschenkoi TaxID=63787 RepID=A0A7N1A801_KALFE
MKNTGRHHPRLGDHNQNAVIRCERELPTIVWTGFHRLPLRASSSSFLDFRQLPAWRALKLMQLWKRRMEPSLLLLPLLAIRKV